MCEALDNGYRGMEGFDPTSAWSDTFFFLRALRYFCMCLLVFFAGSGKEAVQEEEGEEIFVTK